MEAINRLLINKYPNYTVYIDLCPKNFERPSFLIELITIDRIPVNCKTIQETVYFTITCFDETNDYSHSDTTRLLELQRGVLDLFRPGFLTVEDRKISVKASTGGRNFDRAYVDLQFEYNEVRSDAPDMTMEMKDLHVNVVKGE